MVLILFVVQTILIYASKLEVSILNIIVGCVTVISIVLYVYLIRSRLKDERAGDVSEDEMSKKVKIYAGYYSFKACAYLYLLAFSVINLNHLTIDSSIGGLMGLGLFGSSLIYSSTYLYIKNTGNFHD